MIKCVILVHIIDCFALFAFHALLCIVDTYNRIRYMKIPSMMHQQCSLKKKSSSLGVELQPLIIDGNDTSTAISYGTPNETSLASQPTSHSIGGYFYQGEKGLCSGDDDSLKQEETATSTSTTNEAGVPRAVQLMRLENLAIPMCYLCVGIMQGRSSSSIGL